MPRHCDATPGPDPVRLALSVRAWCRNSTRPISAVYRRPGSGPTLLRGGPVTS